jgi:DNA-binding NtrC family response regulator
MKSMAKAKLRILYGEGEIDVLAQQAPAFEKAGHIIVQAAGRKSVEENLKKSTFDLVILGSTLSRNDRHHLPYMVKKANAETSVLVMHADGSRHPYVDACVDTGSTMEHVLNRIESMKIAGMMPQAAAARAGK